MMNLREFTDRTLGALATHTDRVFVEWIIKGQIPGRSPDPYASTSQALAYIEEIEELADTYASLVASDAVLFPEPRDPSGLEEGAGPLWSAARHMRWQTDYEVLDGALQDEYAASAANRTVHTYRFGDGGHRAIVCVHGYMGGHLEVESTLWPVRRFLEQGFDVFLITLPHHGLRMADRFAKPLFPENARYTVEGMRQSVFDVRTLVGMLHGRGYEHVGLVGMSLGGYVVALCLEVESRLSFGVPVIPLTSFARMSEDFDALVGEDASTRARHKRAIASLCAPIDPLARPCLIPPEHVTVVAGRYDGVLAPQQSGELARHIGCDLVRFDGGHLIQRGLRTALDQALQMASVACA